MNKKDYYDKLFFANALFGLVSDIKELMNWSVYNDDKFNEELHQLNEIAGKINDKFEKGVNNNG